MPLQSNRPLDLSSIYPCPICRHGNIEAMVLTEAFACDFCRHILSVNLPQQEVQVLDSTQAIAWKWDGQHWRIARSGKQGDLSGLVVLTSILLIALPASLVGLAGFIFPPMNPAPRLSFANLWALLTLLAHAGLVLWLLGEYYQIPFYIATKVRLLRQGSFFRP